MFSHGLWRGDSGCHDSSLAGEVSGPQVFLITAWPSWADTFLLSDFFFFPLLHFAFIPSSAIVCDLNKYLKCSFYAVDDHVTHRRYYKVPAVRCFALIFFPSVLRVGFLLICCHLFADTSPCCHSVWLSEKSVWVSVENSVQSWARRPPFFLFKPTLLCAALFCISEHRFFFSFLFCNCACRWMSCHP